MHKIIAGAGRNCMLCDLPGDLWKREVYPSVNGIDRFMLPRNEET